jgi:signal peptidase I
MNPTTDTGATEFLANLGVDKVVLIALVLTVVRLFLLRPLSSGHGKPAEIPPYARSLAEILESLIIAAVLVFLIIRPFFVQAFFIPSQSMEPTLLGHSVGDADGARIHTDTVHDHIFVNKLIYRYSEPKFGDIIVFKAPKEADSESKMKDLPQQENVLIKRLIGLPGDTILVKEGVVTRDGITMHAGVVYRNGKQLPDPYINEPIDWPQQPQAHWGVQVPLHLGPNQLFVMGDNRNNSNDSRYWGPLDRNRVIGRAVLIFWPLNRIRLLHYP